MKLPQINRENGIILLAILLIGAWIGVKVFTPKVINETTIEINETSDTTSIEVDTTFSEKATPRRPIKPITIKPKTEDSPEPEKYDSIRSYTGSYSFDYGKFDWQIDTGGILEGYEFKPQFEIPVITHTKEKTITQTRTIVQKGVYLGGGFNTAQDYHFGATYLGNKWMIEYNYTPAYGYGTLPNSIQVHQVGFKYKIF